MHELSAFITTFNNARTLDDCLRSVAWADEIVVLDSYSTDETCDIARRHGCQLYQHEFLGYGPQKQLALDKTRHDWVLLLDADEMLSDPLAEEIKQLLGTEPEADGYEMRRREQVFWRMASPGVRMNYYLRLFRKSQGRISDMPIHAAPKVNGKTVRLRGTFYHFGETDVHTKVEKVNGYSSGLVEHKSAGRRKANPLIMVFYPPWFFVRSFVFKRGFLNGWAGFIASVVSSFYVFMKYAKLYEHFQHQRRDGKE
jgi:glycosyltransferase involved in cell wall biosynthesis